MPAWLRGVPPFYDHLYLQFINDKVAALGVDWLPFQHVRPVPEDNGERFLSEYFKQQKTQEATVQVDPLSD